MTDNSNIGKITMAKLRNTVEIVSTSKYKKTVELIIQEFQYLIYCIEWKTFLLYEEDKGYYKILSEEEFCSLVYDFLKDIRVDWDVNNKLVKEVVATVVIALPRDKRVHESELEHNYISFKNTLLNVETMKTEEYSPNILCYFYIKHEYIADRKAWIKKAPNFLKYLETTFPTADNPDKADLTLVKLVQELVGGLFYANKNANMAIYCQGDGDNGKSLFTESILEEIFPEEFMTATSLELLTADKFGAAELFKKRVSICSEDESDKIKVGKFKNIVTGETMTVQEKYGKLFKFRNFAKLVFTSNITPQFLSFTKSVRKRIRVIPFNGDFSKGSEKRITGLEEKIKKEIPYIISFFLEGLERLRNNNYEFTENSQVEVILNGLRDNANGVSYFISHYCKITEECNTTSTDLFKEYDEIIPALGFGKTSIQKFGRQLLEYEGVKKRQSNKSYYNLELLPESEDLEIDADKLFND